MADYPINKGIGHSVEFKGLKAQYLFIFAGGLLAVFFLVVVLYMAGADQLVCIGLGLTLGSLLVWGTFHLNNKYGEHGLMKLLASKSHPRYILNRRKTNRMFKHKKGSPWFAVLMGSVADSVGAKIRYFLETSKCFCRFLLKYQRKELFSLAIPILFVTFVASFSWMAGREMLAAKSGDWQYLFRIRRFIQFMNILKERKNMALKIKTREEAIAVLRDMVNRKREREAQAQLDFAKAREEAANCYACL